MSGRWVDLRGAAELLGTSTEAVRKRATRGSLRSERRDGRVLVWVDDGRTEGGREAQVDPEAALEAKNETIALLRLQLDAERDAHAETRRLLLLALERIPPQLEASANTEARESPVSPGPTEETPTDAGGGPQTATERLSDTSEVPVGEHRSWWRRVFGG
jgi:hypothetical protein